jgi:hypothetical protein
MRSHMVIISMTKSGRDQQVLHWTRESQRSSIVF